MMHVFMSSYLRIYVWKDGTWLPLLITSTLILHTAKLGRPPQVRGTMKLVGWLNSLHHLPECHFGFTWRFTGDENLGVLSWATVVNPYSGTYNPIYNYP